MVLELRVMFILKYWGGKSIEFGKFQRFFENKQIIISSTPITGDANKKWHMKIGIQIHSLLTPNPYFGKCEPSSEEHKAPWKKETWQLPDKVLCCPVGTHPIYCDVLVLLSLNSVPHTCINTWIFLCTEVYPLTNSLIVLFGKSVKYCACKMLNIVPRLCGDYLS